MKGFVFTEFLEMVENQFGFDMADKIIKEEQLDSKGVYTSIGTYSHGEMVQLVSNLSEETNIPIPDLLRTYGSYLFTVFEKNYKSFFEDIDDSFQFLSQVDEYIHVEVRKLYPDAELPKFDILDHGDNMTMLYQSTRKMSDLAVGLIEKCMEHYQEEGTIKKQVLDKEGEKVLITIVKKK